MTSLLVEHLCIIFHFATMGCSAWLKSVCFVRGWRARTSTFRVVRANITPCELFYTNRGKIASIPTNPISGEDLCLNHEIYPLLSHS